MIRVVNILSLAIAALSAFGLYKTAYHAKEAEQGLARIERDIRAERDLTRLLEAEWAHLNAPHVLQARVRANAAELDLVPVAARQLVSWQEIDQAFAADGALPHAAPRLFEEASADAPLSAEGGETVTLPRAKPAVAGRAR